HQPEPVADGRGPDPLRTGGARPARGRSRLAVRARGPQLRCVHQLRHALLEAEGGGPMNDGDEAANQAPPRLVIGLGSPHGDDQLGWVAVDRLRALLPAATPVVKATGGLALLETLAGQEEVLIIDAAAPAGCPGAIRWLEWPCADLIGLRPLSTH